MGRFVWVTFCTFHDIVNMPCRDTIIADDRLFFTKTELYSKNKTVFSAFSIPKFYGHYTYELIVT